MNEAQKKKTELVEEARQETGAAGDARKYSLRGARLAIQRNCAESIWMLMNTRFIRNPRR